MDRGKLQAWLMASRPRTLTAAVSPVIVGCGLAFAAGIFRPAPALAALFGALFIQIGANFANDYMDFQKGADAKGRLGPTRVTSAGLISLGAMRTGTLVVFGLAVLCGLYLVWSSGWPIVVIGLLSILSALAYTGGPYPLGYNGLGEVFVFLFFGLAGVGGTYFAQTGAYGLTVFAASLPVGCLIVAILVVNNLRDIPTDREAGKRTSAVRYGEVWTQREYVLLLVSAYMLPLVMAVSRLTRPWVLLSWLSIPMAGELIQHVGSDTGRSLNHTLGKTGILVLYFSLFFASGLVLGRLLGM